jgi:hypothetical protein
MKVDADAPFTKKARLEGKGLEDLEADQAEWRCGQPTQENGPWNTLLWRWSSQPRTSRPQDPWNEETIARLSTLSDEIQAAFGKSFEKAADGAPWPFEEGGQKMPKDWCWNSLNLLMEQRFVKMKIYCNRHGISKSTELMTLVERN